MKKALLELKEIIIVVIVVLLLRTFVVEAFNIPSGSMKPTLKVGDFVLVDKLIYDFSSPERGDIIVFKWPRDTNVDFIKRVIGIPGDHIVTKGNDLYINGQKVPYQFIKEHYDKEEGIDKLIYKETLPNGYKNTVEFFKGKVSPLRAPDVNVIVPPNEYFVMGDNRNNSEDSRYWGFVPRSDIVGKAFIIYFSGNVPPLNSLTTNPLIGIKQLIIALLNPRLDRIGMPLINK